MEANKGIARTALSLTRSSSQQTYLIDNNYNKIRVTVNFTQRFKLIGNPKQIRRLTSLCEP